MTPEVDLSGLLRPLKTLPEYRQLTERLRGREATAGAERLSRASRPAVAAALAQDLPHPIMLLTARHDRLLTIAEELSLWDPKLDVGIFPEPNPLFYERAPWGPRTVRQRAATLARLTRPQQPGATKTRFAMPDLILASARATMTRTVSPRDFLANCRWVEEGSWRRLDQLLDHLVRVGYTSSTVVEAPGQFSRRGGILDLWPPVEEHPLRLEFFGNEIDSLRAFDPSTQRSTHATDALRITPAREGMPRNFEDEWREMLPPEAAENSPGAPEAPYLEFFLPWMTESSHGLLDFLPAEVFVVIDDRQAFENALHEFESQAIDLRASQVAEGLAGEEAPLPYQTFPEVKERLQDLFAHDLGFASETLDPPPALGDRFRSGPRFGGQLGPVMKHLSGRQLAHEAEVVVSRQAPRLCELWREEGADAPLHRSVPGDLIPGEVIFVKGALSEGWTVELEPEGALHLLTDAEIFGWARPQPRRRRRQRADAPESSYADLDPGDIVVHVDYGVGRFAGLVGRTLSGLQREYLLVEYAGGGQVYVPVHQADRITRYVGVDGADPRLSRLGTAEWDRVREQAEKAAEEVARDLLELYARRMTVEGHAYNPDTSWQRELEASFPYVETEDQLKAIRAVKEDMEQPRPMDRLVCGDVGYGKTEVALRAAFKAVLDNRQVAMLVPTTILAQQHYNTFRERLSAYPVVVEMLSRFRTNSESTEIIERLRAGDIDVVIGTHRLLQPDVEFNHLGLLIIDEEQRFGVTHKEHLKQMRTQVDVLTMTATPIPRTLYMALTGVRDISTIETPPEERLAVITHVGRYDPRMVRQAILREYDRGGQVFFVHNRVQTIDRIQDRLQRLVPEVNIKVAHGQMPERELADVMQAFSAGDVDVLVSTSIIEAGLDITNANTLIVDRADMFGLAQLYQLRGRVGRGPVRGYAYFFRRPHSSSTEEALERLQVIAENTQLGAGYSIALRDLEIRGAGDILGTRQHGQIAAVGFHLYTRLLNAAVRRLRRQRGDQLPASTPLPSAASALDVAIELPLPSALPPDYVADRGLRLQLYRRMAELRSLEAVEALDDELADRFGQPPEQVSNLIYQLRVKVLAARANVKTVTTEMGQILLEMETEEDKIADPGIGLGSDVRVSRRGLWLRRDGDEDWTKRLLEVLETLAVRASRRAPQREGAQT